MNLVNWFSFLYELKKKNKRFRSIFHTSSHNLASLRMTMRLLRFNALKSSIFDSESVICSSRKLGYYRCIVTTCRAVLLPRFGGPEVLELRQNVNVPNLKPNEVLVRARAVSVNPLDQRVSCLSVLIYHWSRFIFRLLFFVANEL